jgi:Tfp pilus assembly protein PilN
MRAVNLIPADQRGGAVKVAGQSEGGAFVVLGLLAGLAVMALLYGMAHHKISSNTGQAATLTAQAQVAQAQADQLAPYTSFAALHQQRLEAISQLVDTRFDWAHAFHEIGRVLPYDVALSSVHGTVGAAVTTAGAAAPAPVTPPPATSASAAASSVTSATPAGSTPTFTLNGCATSQSEVAVVLDRLRLVDGVSDVELQSSTKPTSSSGGGGSGSSAQAGTCPPKDPAFSVNLTFAALPSTPTGASPAPTGASSAAAASTQPATGSTQPAAAGAQPVSSTPSGGS